ncbi:uncharacterized protein LACBIDRAFT_308001 [Laccaria bicolor S238N-H82]|uniref:Predicted protein n=1 Tax=Laccaria bicolor (strain S238N-H82 / ATCC MYA-4686) TaxID=486041 RepID=B0DRD9_LACBS|nr:uncharacterized protein LACBIDRAFT_308001 [Laccaria bicolor S238N-H82]EDR02769.1 predicted protein [Laccaria bicolor S238N-H82]|eukprot:XP_001886479.1 predicted protein [Laccaria bicolor S238N-H82]
MNNQQYQDIAHFASNYNNKPTSHNSLFQYIVNAPQRSKKKQDLLEAALKKLVMGYTAEPADNWAALVLPYVENIDNWQNTCEAFLQNDNNPDFQYIKVTPSTSRAIAFVNYVIRTVETLKFTIEWETKDQASKSNYLTSLFTQSQDLTDTTIPERKKARKKFVVEHSKLMAARIHLLMLYHSFGVNILLDPFWDIPTKPPTYKRDFLQLSTLLAAHPPSRAFRIDNHTRYLTAEEDERNKDIQELPCNVASMQPGFDTIVGLLDALCGDDIVSDYIESFLNRFPPSFTLSL